MSGALKKIEKPQISCPAGILGYLYLSSNFKKDNSTYEVSNNLSDLPLVSSITDKFTPQGVIEINWSFLKY